VVGAQLSDQVIYPNISVDDSGEHLNDAHMLLQAYGVSAKIVSRLAVLGRWRQRFMGKHIAQQTGACAQR